MYCTPIPNSGPRSSTEECGSAKQHKMKRESVRSSSLIMLANHSILTTIFVKSQHSSPSVVIIMKRHHRIRHQHPHDRLKCRHHHYLQQLRCRHHHHLRGPHLFVVVVVVIIILIDFVVVIIIIIVIVLLGSSSS